MDQDSGEQGWLVGGGFAEGLVAGADGGGGGVVRGDAAVCGDRVEPATVAAPLDVVAAGVGADGDAQFAAAGVGFGA